MQNEEYPDSFVSNHIHARAITDMPCHRCGYTIWAGTIYELDEYSEPTHRFCFPAKDDPLKPQ